MVPSCVRLPIGRADAAAGQLHAGDEGGGDGAEAGEQDAERPSAGRGV
jgi:hypothetical protein